MTHPSTLRLILDSAALAADGTREEPGTLIQGGALFSLVCLVWESNPKLQGVWCKTNYQTIGGSDPTGLSFRKYNARTNVNLTLQQRILSQLDDDLPDLDPTLAAYVRKFRIPDSELFLRIIRCPNILALRELAKQHLSPEPQKHMR
jgi:hypothetical protein